VSPKGERQSRESGSEQIGVWIKHLLPGKVEYQRSIGVKDYELAPVVVET
jgi:hypothetical protein